MNEPRRSACPTCGGRGHRGWHYTRDAQSAVTDVCPDCEWFCRSLFGLKCSQTENDGRDHDQCGFELRHV
jgi:hypothetical protein